MDWHASVKSMSQRILVLGAGGVGGDGSEGMWLDEADGNDEDAPWPVQSSPKFDGSERK